MFFFYFLCCFQCIDQLTRIQSELQDTVKDLAKSKKKYFETEQMAHTVREKADIEAKYVPILLEKLHFFHSGYRCWFLLPSVNSTALHDSYWEGNNTVIAWHFEPLQVLIQVKQQKGSKFQTELGLCLY